ncbi:MAG: adenylyl-sulfate kinase [Pseudomonadota bacterium]
MSNIHKDHKVWWFTGLSGSGKSTLANSLASRLQEMGKPVFVLDGDQLRQGLCSDLGLSDADRKENIRRAGEVAKILFSTGLDVCCAFISPFAEDRKKVRSLFPENSFMEIHLTTSLDECVKRDPKGLYAKAKSGLISGMTGIDSPYEPPKNAEWAFDTQIESIDHIIAKLIYP